MKYTPERFRNERPNALRMFKANGTRQPIGSLQPDSDEALPLSVLYALGSTGEIAEQVDITVHGATRVPKMMAIAVTFEVITPSMFFRPDQEYGITFGAEGVADEFVRPLGRHVQAYLLPSPGMLRALQAQNALLRQMTPRQTAA
jgi:hypothetical protein